MRPVLLALVLLVACSRGAPPVRGGRDAGGVADAGVSALDAAGPADTGLSRDAGVGRDVGPGADSGARDSGARDSGARDGGTRDSSASVDVGVVRDQGTSRDSGGSTRGEGLDPALAPAAASGAPCATPGQFCPGVEVCRFFSATESRCESCTACGNLNAACTAGDDCDILFACYQGRCTNICPLGTSYCGPPADCLNVGHPTIGVCRPR